VTDNANDLGVQALTHLGTAVMQSQCAIGKPLQQGACLIEMGGIKANAKLDWRYGNSSR
jgi:hypothetical protein